MVLKLDPPVWSRTMTFTIQSSSTATRFRWHETNRPARHFHGGRSAPRPDYGWRRNRCPWHSPRRQTAPESASRLYLVRPSSMLRKFCSWLPSLNAIIGDAATLPLTTGPFQPSRETGVREPARYGSSRWRKCNFRPVPAGQLSRVPHVRLAGPIRVVPHHPLECRFGWKAASNPAAANPGS